MKFSIYNPIDTQEIKQLFTVTFSNSEEPSEGLLIGNLAYNLLTSTNNHDLYSFVATENEQIIGAIIFTKLTFEKAVNAFILSPVAIHTDYQRKGIGQKLINYGLNTLKKNGVELAFTYGDPDFYSKVGFNHIDEEHVKAPLKLSQPEGWLGQSLVSDQVEPIAGNSFCVKALNKDELW